MKTNAALKMGRSINGNSSAEYIDPKETLDGNKASLDPKMMANPEYGEKPDDEFINAVIELSAQTANGKRLRLLMTTSKGPRARQGKRWIDVPT